MRIAILGLGIIGQAWADNLRADGHELRLWNRTPRGVPGFVADAAEAARGADAAILVVADPPAVDAVMGRIGPALGEGQVVIQCSTVDPGCNKRACAIAEARKARFLEAPFTGSKPAAVARQTVFYVGGEAPAMEAAKPALARLAKAILHIGPVGTASALKLAMNLNIAAVAQALCETVTLTRAAGISDDTFFEALKLNASRSGVVDLKEAKLRGRDWSPQFSIKHMNKDLALAAGEAKGKPLALLPLLSALYARGMSAGWSEDDYISLIRLAEGTQGARG